MTRLRILAVAALAALLATQAAQADTIVYYREGQRVDPHDVAQVLGGGTTRGIRLLDGPATAGGAPAVTALAALTSVAQTSQPGDSPAAADALSLPVQFEFDSAKITPSARTQLDALAEGIKLLQPDRSVVIEGHTDARGSEFYNEVLSTRRAAAVKIYLVEMHGIEPQRLKAVGFGKQQPIEGRDPFAGENRRVQFRGG